MTRSEAVRNLLAALEEVRRVQSDDTDDALADAVIALTKSKPAPRGEAG